MNDFYQLSYKNTLGKTVSLKRYANKTLLIVNTATKCGLAPQFEGLEKLHQQYKEKGLVVIGFPCNQFAGQEPETNDTVVGVCLANFGVSFELSEIIYVNGPNTHPIFKYLKENSPTSMGKAIKWNFTKFLVAPGAASIKRYAPTTQPNALRADIEIFLVR